MAATEPAGYTNGVVPAPDLSGPEVAPPANYEKYAEERNKRSGKGLGQYIDLAKSDKFTSLLDDPWIEAGAPINQVVDDGGHRKVLIVGGGFGGILFAVKLLQNGFSVDDLLIVESGGGFGGTWYWNRYPGLMCDVESYIYCPLLEEMDYMPKEKYASGHELRLYCESICKKYGLEKCTMFQSKCDVMVWNEAQQRYEIQITQKPKGGQEKQINITSTFAVVLGGILHKAKVPDLKGYQNFEGEMFHTSRWQYSVTGGTPSDPTLEKLRDKRVAIIGTGATSIQIVPQLAKWAKELVVFQRTPSSVDERGNRDTDPKTWKTEVATKPGWQRERNINYFSFVGNHEKKPEKDLISDGWTRMPSFSAIIGSPSYKVTMENVVEHVGRMNALDYPHQDGIRQRAKKIVKDQKTAESLQAWFAGWCKRPCFHDEYLPAFNKPNVTLVDTNGKGVDQITPTGIQFDGREYDVDVLVLSTGFVSPAVGNAITKADIHLTGRDGKTLEEHWANGISTLHGCMSRGFPNLYWPGPSQSGASPNYTFLLEHLAAHVAYVIGKADQKALGKAVSVEPTAQAEGEWAMRIMAGAAAFASVGGCTPGYLNREGESDGLTPEQQVLAARGSPWPHGIVDYVHTLEAWRSVDDLAGLEIVVAT